MFSVASAFCEDLPHRISILALFHPSLCANQTEKGVAAGRDSLWPTFKHIELL